MQIEKAAVAGTLESSDCMVTVEDGDGNIDLVLFSCPIRRFICRHFFEIIDAYQKIMEMLDGKHRMFMSKMKMNWLYSEEGRLGLSISFII